MWKILTAASTALVLIGSPALAQMEEWDLNADAAVDQNEFDTGFGEGGVFGDWDADQDEQLTEDEWGTGFGDIYDEEQFGAYEDWDEDESGFLSEDEFNAGVYGGYDADDDDAWNDQEYGAYEEDEWF